MTRSLPSARIRFFHAFFGEELDATSFAFACWACVTCHPPPVRRTKVVGKQLEPDTVREPVLSCLSFIIDISEFLARKKTHLSRWSEKNRRGHTLGMSLTTGAQATPTSGPCILTMTGDFLRAKNVTVRGVWATFWVQRLRERVEFGSVDHHVQVIQASSQCQKERNYGALFFRR
jgi:hypothetical protein